MTATSLRNSGQFSLPNKKRALEIVPRDEINQRLRFAATAESNAVLAKLGTTEHGLSESQVDASRDQYGDNKVTHGTRKSLFMRLCEAFINPFTTVLFVLAVVSVF